MFAIKKSMCNIFLNDLIDDRENFIRKIKNSKYHQTKWLADMDGFDYEQFDIKWLEGCSDMLLKSISKNIIARKAIAEKYIQLYKDGDWNDQYAENYFKYFSQDMT